MSRFKLLIFDFDGTLGDTKGLIVNAMHQAMRIYGWDFLPVAECESIIGLPLKEGFRKIYPDLDEEGLDGRCMEYREYFMENCMGIVPDAFPHVEDTLSELKARGIRMTIASSRHKSSLVQYLDGMHLLDYFELIIGPEDVAHGKPDPDPVLKTLEIMGCDADLALVVGDTSYDILMGVRAGVHTCGVSYGVGDENQLKEAGAEYIINDMADIVALTR